MLLTNDINISPYCMPGIVVSKPPTVDRIIDAVCEHFGITKKDLIKKDRHRDIVFARQLAIYLIRFEAKLYVVEIGKIFKKDHTTVVYSTNQINDYISIRDPKVINALNSIKTIIRNSR